MQFISCSHPSSPLIPCTMPPIRTKKPDLLSHSPSVFGGRGGRSTVDSRRGSDEIANAGAGPSHPPTHSVPDLSLPVDDSTPQCHGSQPPIRPSRSENEIVDSLQPTALSMSGNQDLRPPPQAFPTLHSYEHPAGPRAHGGTASFLAGASGFRMGDVNYIDASHVTVHTAGRAGDRSVDGMSIPPRG